MASKIPIIINVLAAFFGAGSLKLGMAFDMASTPVKAELHEANDFNKINKLIPTTGVPIGVCNSGETPPVIML
jgi:hypothetical protein